MSFGRKGVANGVGTARPARRMAGAASSSQTASLAGESTFAEPGSEMAAKREAFIAAERARRQGHEAPKTEAIPARRDPNIQAGRPDMAPSYQPAQNAGKVSTQSSNVKPYSRVFGHPDKRQIALAYVFWYFSGLLSFHRIYCGQLESAIYQIALLFISVVCLFIFAPLGVAGFIGWCLWIFADLFLIPGMMRRFRAQHAQPDTQIFA